MALLFALNKNTISKKQLSYAQTGVSKKVHAPYGAKERSISKSSRRDVQPDFIVKYNGIFALKKETIR